MQPIIFFAIMCLSTAAAAAAAANFDSYGGYRSIQSSTHRSHTGTSAQLDAYRLVDPTANFPPNGLVDKYLHPNATLPFIPVTRRTKHLEALRYRIVRNTRTEIFTSPDAGKLTQYAQSGDPYKTSGFFTIEKLGPRWWYITPEGHAFIALSVSAVNPNGKDGHDRSGKTYGDYVKAKYGGERVYRANWANATLDRLRRWGFNTIGTFSHKVQTHPYLTQRMPYVMTLRLSNRAVLKKAVGNIWSGIGGGKFPDLWHPDFAATIDQHMQRLASDRMRRDPYILYLFPDQADELRGIGQHHYSLGWAALVGQPQIDGHPNYTKPALRDWLQQRYSDITRLNAAWKTRYTTWDRDGGYPNGRGFLDQGKKGVPGPTYKALDQQAPAAMRADLDAFVEHLLRRYATTVTATIRRYTPHHLISTPNSVTLKAAIKAFDGHFDLFWARDRAAYDLLKTKRPFAATSMGYLSAEADSPLRLQGQLSPQFEIQTVDTKRGPRQYLKVWDRQQDFWFTLKGKNPLHIALFNEQGQMLDMGRRPGNRYDLLDTGTDADGGWMLLRSRGYNHGTIEEFVQRLGGNIQHPYCQSIAPAPSEQPSPRATAAAPPSWKQWMKETFCQALTTTPVSSKIYYRRRGYGDPNAVGLSLGYPSQADRAQAWQAGLHRDLTERATNGDYFRIGTNWWKFSDNGWTYWLERYNFGLVTLKDNAYDGREAMTSGADGVPGTVDDEPDDYGDLLTDLARTNTGLYRFLQQHDAATP